VHSKGSDKFMRRRPPHARGAQSAFIWMLGESFSRSRRPPRFLLPVNECASFKA
jgi:hypothetical protein